LKKWRDISSAHTTKHFRLWKPASAVQDRSPFGKFCRFVIGRPD
jgi:hypothetical protein